MRILLALLGLLGTAAVARAGDVEQTAHAYNEMGFHLLAQCRQSLGAPNYFLSPAGLAFTLAMVGNGAQGETARQIMATLQAANVPAAQLNEANKALLARLANLDPKIKLEIANAIWVDQRASIKPAFISLNERDFGAKVATADFHNPATVKDINDWVSARTHDKIPSILQPPLEPMLRVLLLDAIYFKGDWQDPFRTNDTRTQPFTLRGGQVIQHPRMMRTGHCAYFESDRCQTVELPYAGGDVCMDIFLPSGSLDDFLKDFTAGDFQKTLAQMPSRRVTVELPRFKLENNYDLTRVLGQMGMPRAFTRSAEFGAMSDEPLQISLVKQKTYVDVNEKGTEAAAVTVVGVRAMAMRVEEPPVQFVVDRPFFMAIREKQTGLILFLGAIYDPR